MQISSVKEVGSPNAPVRPRVKREPDTDTDAAPALDQVALTSASAAPAAEGTPATDGPASPADPPSEIKSFAYGALGIDPQAEQASPKDPSYSAGQWTGAALKIGGIIALFA